MLPEVVTVPERLKPFTEPVPDTDVTVPAPPVAVKEPVSYTHLTLPTNREV